MSTSDSEDSDDDVRCGANSDETSDSEDDDDDELYRLRGFVQQLKRGNQALHSDYNMLILWYYSIIIVFDGSPHKGLVYSESWRS